jgi:molybdopterin converting factor small subunit
LLSTFDKKTGCEVPPAGGTLEHDLRLLNHFWVINTIKYLVQMKSHIQIKLFATLQEFMPVSAENYAIEAGTTVSGLLRQLDLPPEKVKLVFINGARAELTSILKGGERVGIFPPVGGG